MTSNLKSLIGGSVIAVLLSACGGGSSANPQAQSDDSTRSKAPAEVASLINKDNDLTEELCPEAAAEDGEAVDPDNCVAESEEQSPKELSLNPVVQQFCPEASEVFDATLVLEGEMLDQDFAYDTDSSFDGTLTFPVQCLQEAAGNFDQMGDMIGGSNPLTEQICPNAAAADSFAPQDCFTEALGSGGLPGGDGGSLPGADQLTDQLCPEAGQAELGPETPINCLKEAGETFAGVADLISGSNPLTEQICPMESADGNVDPQACFAEAVMGEGGFPGEGGGNGGGDEGSNPFAPALEQVCPETAVTAVGPTTPVDCLAEAGEDFGEVQDLLLGANPLTENLCPEAANDAPIDPAACFMEAAGGGLPGGDGGGLPGGGGNPLAPALEPFCPGTAAGDVGPTTPIDCLTEAGGNFGEVQDLLLGANPLTENLCPEAANDAPIDPAACFEEAAGGGLPGGDGGGLPGGGGDNPLAPALEPFCPGTAAGEVGPTTPIDCLTEAGGNFGDVQDLLLGANPLTENLCPEAASNAPIDPAACFEEAAGGGLPGGDGGGLPGGGGGNPLAPALEPFCPGTAAGDVGPTTPIDCLTEAGGNFGDVQDLLLGANPLTENLCPEAAQNAPIDPAACFEEAAGGGLPGGDGGGLPGGGGDNPLAPALESFCPETAAGDIGPTTPFDCFSEAGASLEALEELTGPLQEPNPLTEQLCPEASATGTVDPTACFVESMDNVALLDTSQIGLLPGCPLLAGGNNEGNPSVTLGLACLLNQASGDAGGGEEGNNNPIDMITGLLGGAF